MAVRQVNMAKKSEPRISFNENKQLKGHAPPKLQPNEILVTSTYGVDNTAQEKMAGPQLPGKLTSDSGVKTSLKAAPGNSASVERTEMVVLPTAASDLNANKQGLRGVKWKADIWNAAVRHVALAQGDQLLEQFDQSEEELKSSSPSGRESEMTRVSATPRETVEKEDSDLDRVYVIDASIASPQKTGGHLVQGLSYLPSDSRPDKEREEVLRETAAGSKEDQTKADEPPVGETGSETPNDISQSPSRAVMGVCDSCRVDVPFGQSKDYVVAIEKPDRTKLGVQDQWALVHPPPVPFKAAPSPAENTNTIDLGKLSGNRHPHFPDLSQPVYDGSISVHNRLSEFLDDTGVDDFAKLFLNLKEAERVPVPPAENAPLEDTMFPVGHKLGTSEGLRQAMERLRVEERRRSYRNPHHLTQQECSQPEGSLVACHNRLPRTTKTQLKVKYRHMASQINRGLYEGWHAETTARAAFLTPTLFGKPVGSVKALSSKENSLATEEKHPNSPQERDLMTKMYGKSRFNLGKIQTANNEIQPAKSLPFAPPLFTDYDKYSTPTKTTIQGTYTPEFTTDLKSSITDKKPNSVLKNNVGLASSEHFQSHTVPVENPDYSKTWPLHSRHLETRRSSNKKKMDHPRQCVCEACTKAANWVHTMGLSCFSGGESIPTGDSEQPKSPKWSKNSEPGSDLNPMLRPHEGESPQILQVQPIGKDFRAWEIQKLENMLRHKDLKQTRPLEKPPKGNFWSPSV